MIPKLVEESRTRSSARSSVSSVAFGNSCWRSERTLCLEVGALQHPAGDEQGQQRQREHRQQQVVGDHPGQAGDVVLVGLAAEVRRRPHGRAVLLRPPVPARGPYGRGRRRSTSRVTPSATRRPAPATFTADSDGRSARRRRRWLGAARAGGLGAGRLRPRLGLRPAAFASAACLLAPALGRRFALRACRCGSGPRARQVARAVLAPRRLIAAQSSLGRVSNRRPSGYKGHSVDWRVNANCAFRALTSD